VVWVVTASEPLKKRTEKKINLEVEYNFIRKLVILIFFLDWFCTLLNKFLDKTKRVPPLT